MSFINCFFIGIISMLAACYTHQDYDGFIEKYESYNFDEFKGINVSFRSSDGIENVYVVSDKEGRHPVYFVHYNIIERRVSFIDKRMLKKLNVKDYIENKKIHSLIKRVVDFDFYILGVDGEDNVYINPYKRNAPAIFLRLKNDSKEKTIKKGFTYNHYKGKWYINEIQ